MSSAVYDQIIEEIFRVTTTCFECKRQVVHLAEDENGFTPPNWFLVSDVDESCNIVGGVSHYCPMCIGSFIGSETRKVYIPTSSFDQCDHWFKAVEDGFEKRREMARSSK